MRVGHRAVLLAMLLVILGVSTWLAVARRTTHVDLLVRAPGTPAASEPPHSSEADGTAELMEADLRGKPAPDFVLRDLSGRKISLADLKGHSIVVNFWASYCGPCKLEMPWFEELEKKYRGRGLVILGINQDQDIGRQEIAAAAKRLGVTYPILMPDHAISKRYGGVDYLPETFYIDRNGTVLAQAAGARTAEQIEMNIRKSLGLALNSADSGRILTRPHISSRCHVPREQPIRHNC